MAQTLDDIYAEEKHMPGRHDQTSHSGGAAGAALQTPGGKVPSTAKMYREQLLKQRSALATELDKAKKPEQQAELTKQLKELDKKIKTVPALSSPMTPAKHDALMKKRSALATEAESLQNRAGPKSTARKAELKKNIANIDTIVRENPLPKKVKKPKATAPAVGEKKPAVATPEGKKGIFERAKAWLSNVDAKIGEAFTAMEAYPIKKLNEIATRLGKHREVNRLYDDWNRKQARAGSTYKQLKLEYAKPSKNGIPSRKFYDMAVRFRNEQIAAAQSRNKFETTVGFSDVKKSEVDEIEILESPYEGTDNARMQN